MPSTEETNIPVLTLEAANALVPRLNLVVGEQLLRRQEIEARLKDLAEEMGHTPESLAEAADDSLQVRKLKGDLIARVEEYEHGWRPLDEMGAVLKDPRTGLIDFYGRVEGKLVWLCWKFGEQEVNHYHALDEGFSGRKAIAGGVRSRLLN
jgi:hypothetical protein